MTTFIHKRTPSHCSRSHYYLDPRSAITTDNSRPLTWHRNELWVICHGVLWWGPVMVRDEGPCSLQWGIQRTAWDKRPMCGDTPFMFGSWVWPEGCLAVLFAQLNPYLSLSEETGQRGSVHQGHPSMSCLNEHNLTSPNDLSGPNDSFSHHS